MIVTRFAPSPTGRLHLGHALSVATGWHRARVSGGAFRLRIEDLDSSRCRPDFDAAILADLAWLGIDPDGPVMRQSQRRNAHGAALARLRALGVVYPCTCTRIDIAAAGAAPHGPPHGPDGPIYPGTCRERPAAPENAAWRLDSARAAALTGSIDFTDSGAGRMAVDPLLFGDIVVARRDIGAAYHLAVVVDDAAQGVSEVVRGIDLLPACHVQRLLQALLGLPAPRYHHHPLVTDADGRRLAKRDRAATLAALRDEGIDGTMLRDALIAGDWSVFLRPGSER